MKRTPRPLLLVAGLALAVAACGRVSDQEARRLVERYNRVVSEAYRRGDVRLVDDVVGPQEGKKLTGLIGVRLDMGLALDSQLQELAIDEVRQRDGELQVHTRECWTYCDRRIGSGEPVGTASTDRYAMAYVFIRTNRNWLVDEIRFLEEPTVGRTAMTWSADARMLHGVVAPPAGAAGEAPP